MSNVLIGIIGVILFIGLALAGALFLGPRFQEAKVNSDAAVIVQGVKQMADAYELYRAQGGPALRDGDQDVLMAEGFLKDLPRNPAVQSHNYGTSFMLSYSREAPPSPRTGVLANFAVVFIYLPSTPTRAERICEVVAKQLGQQEPINQWVNDAKAGCSPFGPGWIAFVRL